MLQAGARLLSFARVNAMRMIFYDFTMTQIDTFGIYAFPLDTALLNPQL